MTSAYQQNLTVLTDHILHLAEKHAKTSDQITGANRSIADPAREVMDTHGIACGATNLAVSSAEAARRTAGAALLRVSKELHEELKSAAAYYENTDASQAGNVIRCEA
jgi:predicted HicB family RNase H-like nuclease